MHTLRIIGSKAFGSQRSSNHHVAHICGGEYSARARFRLLFEFTQHMLFKFRCPLTPDPPFIVHPTGKRTGFIQTSMQTFESFLVWQTTRRKSFPVQSSGLQGIPIRNAVNEIDNGHYLIYVASHPYSLQKQKKDECRLPELLQRLTSLPYVRTIQLNPCVLHFSCKSGILCGKIAHVCYE
ncbi:hypothetical protein TNCV_4021 [Trichonephila clavipes]|nr:hypothetical protein TNCV_4021 [Trichonephila clavipes]